MPSIYNGTTTQSKPQVARVTGNTPKSVKKDAPVADQKKRLVRKQVGANPLKQKAWLAGHAVTAFFGLVSMIFQVFWLPNVYYINSICYRLTFFGAILALTGSLSHRFGLSYLPPFSALAVYQSFQYLVLAIVWLLSFKSVLKILPYILISILQLSSHFKVSIILSQSEYLASIIAYNELVLVFYLFLRTLCFRNASGYQLAIFLAFYWLRILYNKETRTLFGAIVNRLDGKLSGIKNEKVQHIWTRIKEFLAEKQKDQK